METALNRLNKEIAQILPIVTRRLEQQGGGRVWQILAQTLATIQQETKNGRVMLSEKVLNNLIKQGAGLSRSLSIGAMQESDVQKVLHFYASLEIILWLHTEQVQQSAAFKR